MEMPDITKKANLTKKHVQMLLNVKDHTVNQWLRDGLPHGKDGRKVMIDPVEMVKWMSTQGSRMRKYLAVLESKIGCKIDPCKAQSGDMRLPDTDDNPLRHARDVERWYYAMWKATGDNMPGTKLALAEGHGKAMEVRRKYELDLPTILNRAKSVMPVEEIISQIGRAFTTVKQDMLAIPNAPEFKTVSEPLTLKIKDALRKLAKEFKQSE